MTVPCEGVSWATGLQEMQGQGYAVVDDNRYHEATTMWNTYAVSKVQVIVEPSKESDISTVVSTLYYC